MLHTLMQSPWQSDLDSLLLLLQPGDDLLLLQDGVTAALQGSAPLARLLASAANVYVLQEDVTARGLAAQISTEVQWVDYTGFVALTAGHPKQMTW